MSEHVPLIISFVARSGTGKTTYLERLLPQLKAMGLRVGVLKHHAHATPFDTPGKDTYRMFAAGADLVVGVSPFQTAVFLSGDYTTDLDGVIERLLPGMDFVFTEGFKRGPYPKIEIYRAARAAQEADGRALLCEPQELLAVVTDTPLPVSVPLFAINDPGDLAAFLYQHFLSSRAEQKAISLQSSSDGATKLG